MADFRRSGETEEDMILTSENYFSPEALTKYFSVSQYKDFVGTMGQRGCEAMALAKMRGEWTMEMTPALLIGSYVDAHFEGTLDVFKAQHPEICKKDGSLLAAFEHANTVIARIERDEYFMKFLAGEKQVILTAEIFGVQWKVKIDSLMRGMFAADLKVMRAIHDSFWVKDAGYMSFVEYWGYDLQAAIYQKVIQLNINELLPFFIAAATKEKFPDIQIIGFTQNDLDSVLSTVEPNIQRIRDLKTGHAFPDRCEDCDYCKATKVLSKPVHFSELILKIWKSISK